MSAEQQEKQTVEDEALAHAGIEDAEAGAPQYKESATAEAEATAADTEAEELEEAPADELSAEDEFAEKLAAARDQVLRAQAEVQNIRRRAERDVENAHKFALEKFAGALLPVVDNLERALDAMDRDDERSQPLIEGVELTHRSFSEALRRFNIEVVDPVGAPFDPACHEAMSMIENNEVEANTVLQVIQKGYTLNGRVLRAAMVIVSRPGQQESVDETV